MRNFAFVVGMICLLWACSGSEPQQHSERELRIAEMSENWSSSPNYQQVFVPLSPLSVDNSDDILRAVFDASDDYSGLPRTGEYEYVELLCSSCHSLEIVMQQRATRERWSYMLTWMTEKQGMAELPPEDTEAIIEYLAEHFGP